MAEGPPPLRMKTPLLEDDAAARLNALEMARNNVLVYQFFQTLAWGIFFEVYSFYVTDGICDGDSARGAAVATYNSMLYGFCQFFSNPINGSISDSVGRRPVLIVGCLSCGLGFCAYGLLPYVQAYLLIGVAVGLTNGSNTASFATLVDCVTQGLAAPTPRLPGSGPRELCLTRLFYSLARDPATAARATGGADGAKPEFDLNYELSLVYMVLWAWSLLGMLMGIGVATLLLQYVSYQDVMSVSGVVLLPLAVYMAACHPETLPPSKRKEVSARLLRDAVCNQVRSITLLASNKRIGQLSAINFLVTCAIYGQQTIVLFWLEYKFAFSSNETALALVLSLVTISFWGWFTLRYGLTNLGYSKSFQWLLVLVGVAMTTQCFVYSGNWQFAFLAFRSAMWCVQPLVTATMTPEVEYEDQGRLQGAIYGVQMLGNLAGSFGFLRLFLATRGSYSNGSSAARHDLAADSANFLAAAIALFAAGLAYLTPEARAEAQALGQFKAGALAEAPAADAVDESGEESAPPP